MKVELQKVEEQRLTGRNDVTSALYNVRLICCHQVSANDYMQTMSCFTLKHLSFYSGWCRVNGVCIAELFFKSKLSKTNKKTPPPEFGLSQLNCRLTTTDGLTAMTPSPPPSSESLSSCLPIAPFHLWCHPSCFSPSVSPLPALLIYLTHPWSHIWTVLSLKLSVTNHLWVLNQRKHHHGATITQSVKLMMWEWQSLLLTVGHI